MLVLKICINEWVNESRDQRELTVCRELGADIKVVAKGKSDDYGTVDIVNGFEVHRLSSRPVRNFPNSLNRVLSIFIWAKYVRTLRPDIISGHDISGLAIGWLSTFFCKVKPKLVYDSHEFEIGRNVKRNCVQIKFITIAERYLIKKSKFMIVVNDSIADEVTRIHKLKQRPVVVRNIPSKWNVDRVECDKIRSCFMDEFKIRGGVSPNVSWSSRARQRN